MIPCGFAHEVASLEILGVSATLDDVGRRIAVALAARLGRSLEWEVRLAPARDDEIPADAPVRDAEDLLTEAVTA